jgi:mono/diheme cytochrome c family protein
MPRVKSIVVFVVCCALLAAGRPSSGALLQSKRSSATDLQVTGMIAGIAPGAVRYISYKHLLKLPTITIPIQPDDNFAELPPQKIVITGIYLDVLARSLGALPGADLIVAICSDRYHAHFSREYTQQHRPIFALKINGQPVETWAKKTRNKSPGTYFITYAAFTPSFKVLSYEEMPQIPAAISGLDFNSSPFVFGAIAPSSRYASNPEIDAGYRIAKQSCLRCHNMESSGGTKAGRTWQTLGTRAATSPASFERLVRDPKSIDPNASMPPNPSFDDAIVKALQAYFQTFSAETH